MQASRLSNIQEVKDAGAVGGWDVGEGAGGAEAAAPAVEGGGVPAEEVGGKALATAELVLDLLDQDYFVDGAGGGGFSF